MTGQNAIQKYTFGAVADVLGCFGIPTGTAMNIYHDILDNRAHKAMDILMSEIRGGDFSNVDQNEAVSVIARYQRDAMEGAARNNLRLMARVINGMAEENKLEAPCFLRYANILASLTEEEIKVLGVMIKYQDKTEEKDRKKRHEELEATCENAHIYLQALMRTGLIFQHTASGYGGTVKPITRNYDITHMMDEILRYTDFMADDNNQKVA